MPNDWNDRWYTTLVREHDDHEYVHYTHSFKHTKNGIKNHDKTHYDYLHRWKLQQSTLSSVDIYRETHPLRRTAQQQQHTTWTTAGETIYRMGAPAPRSGDTTGACRVCEYTLNAKRLPGTPPNSLNAYTTQPETRHEQNGQP